MTRRTPAPEFGAPIDVDVDVDVGVRATAVLDEPVWRARAAAHRARVERWTGPHRERRRRGEPHPVMDFLFTYYSLRPQRLEQWHPGPDVVLRGAEGYLGTTGYMRAGAGVRLDPARLPDRLPTTAGFVRALLTATASRPPRLSCFGMHEWAMVYRNDAPRPADDHRTRTGPRADHSVHPAFS